MSNIDPLGKTNQNCKLPFSCLFPQPFISSRIWLRQFLYGMGRVWEKFELGRAPILEKSVLTSSASKKPKNVCHSTMHPRFSLPCIFVALMHSPFTFLQCSSFSPSLGSRFCKSQWLGSLLDIFVFVFLITQMGKTVFGLHNELQKRPTIFGCWLSLFLPM